MHHLSIAFDDYYEAFQSLPLEHGSTEAETHLTTGAGEDTLMMALTGFGDSGGESAKHQIFFSFKSSKSATNGLLTTTNSAELFDPWGNPYHVLLDYNRDSKLQDPSTGKIITDQKILIWSPGPDGKSGTLATDQDNLCSWR